MLGHEKIELIMMTSTASRTGEFELPLDLSQWVEPEMLGNWVGELVGSLDWQNPELQKFLQANPRFQPRPLLSLLLHSYALGRFASEDVAGDCYRDPQLRRWLAGDVPAVKTLSLFRRENRGLLKWGLMELLKRSFRQKYQLGDGLLPSGLRRHLEDMAISRVDIARHMDRGGSL